MKKIMMLAMACAVVLTAAAKKPQPSVDASALVAHIDSTMPQTVREMRTGDENVIGLPKSYSVPCVRGAFQEMYYWDTYFTNVGLLLMGDVNQARNNVDCITYLINKFGYMPNGSHRFLLSRSQPPYASMMVREVYEKTHDRAWLAGAARAIEKEYEFWMTQRITPIGLNRYGYTTTDDDLVGFYGVIANRLGIDVETYKTREERVRMGGNWLAEAESGWDFNPRYELRCMDFAPLDLNGLLYTLEKNMEYFYKQLGWKNSKKWADAAKKRLELVQKYCYNPADGLFYDYDYVNQRLGKTYSAAAFNLAAAGMLTKKQAKAMHDALGKLEMEHGIAACEPGERTIKYQWDYPNCWAALNYNAIKAMDRYGYKADARRLAQKYLDSNVRQWRATGVLWEKYNALTGNNDAVAEYATPGDFMGWTAGVSRFCYHYLYE